MKTIVFCIPGCNFSHKFLRCWTNLLFWCIQNNINPVLSNDVDSNVYFVRAKILGGSTLRGKNKNHLMEILIMIILCLLILMLFSHQMM